MAVSNSDTVILPDVAIPLSDFQNASSRLTLVLCPPRTTDRFTIRDFIFGLVLNSGFIPVVGMAGKETGSTDDAWERHGLFRCGAFIAARSNRPSINIRKRPPLPEQWIVPDMRSLSFGRRVDGVAVWVFTSIAV